MKVAIRNEFKMAVAAVAYFISFWGHNLGVNRIFLHYKIQQKSLTVIIKGDIT